MKPVWRWIVSVVAMFGLVSAAVGAAAAGSAGIVVQGYAVPTNTPALAQDCIHDECLYGSRWRLGNYQLRSQITGNPQQFYYFATDRPYWSVISVIPAPGGGWNDDVVVYGDSSYQPAAQLKASEVVSDAPDFLVVDSNRRAYGNHYVRAYYAGAGTHRGFDIEYAQGSDILSLGVQQPVKMVWSSPSPSPSSTPPASGPHFLAVRDIKLEAGKTYKLSLICPTNADGELFIMGSTSGSPATYVQGRAEAKASASLYGAGRTEQLTITATETAWYGVVIVNKSRTNATFDLAAQQIS